MIRKTILVVAAFLVLFASPAAAQYSGPDNGSTPVTSPGPSQGGSGGTDAGTGSGGTGIRTGELPRTGTSDSIRTVTMVGAGLLAAGGMVLLSARRRNASI